MAKRDGRIDDILFPAFPGYHIMKYVREKTRERGLVSRMHDPCLSDCSSPLAFPPSHVCSLDTGMDNSFNYDTLLYYFIYYMSMREYI
jgi:hypothetical protein